MDGDFRYSLVRDEIRHRHEDNGRQRLARSDRRIVVNDEVDRRQSLGVLSLAGTFARRVGRRALSA